MTNMNSNSGDGADYDYDDRTNGDADPWAGWRIPSQDHNGHTERTQVRIQPAHLRMAQNYVNSRAFPYRDTGDLIRHALHLHLLKLGAITNIPIASVMQQVEAANIVLGNEEYMVEYQTLFERLSKQVQSLLNLNSPREAGQIVRQIRQLLSDMPTGAWRSRYLKEIDARFGELARLEPVPEHEYLPQPPSPPSPQLQPTSASEVVYHQGQDLKRGSFGQFTED